jgi:hypothetical protein
LGNLLKTHEKAINFTEIQIFAPNFLKIMMLIELQLVAPKSPMEYRYFTEKSTKFVVKVHSLALNMTV